MNKYQFFTLSLVLMFLNFSVSGQGKKGEIVIDDSNIKTWIQAKANDYQSLYHFSNSEAESNLVLIMDQDSCYAQIQSGEWGKIDGKDHWIVKIETLKNVRINGNRFFSDKTNGEFVIFNHDNKQLKALMVYKPWSSWIFFANGKGFEMGNSSGPVDTHFPGKFPQASYRQLDKDELAKMTHSDLQLMRNEIYARYGYIFKPHGEMDLYFNKQSWYRGQNKNIDDCLTGLERRNIELIQSAENRKSTF